MKTPMTDAQWQAQLMQGEAEPLAFEVTRHAATERPFSGRYNRHFAPGQYHCICCDKTLFASTRKFDAGCGWPSFDQSASPDSVQTRVDRSHGMLRTEVLCPDCGAHLGHVFEDGPTDTGLRYCINSAALGFKPQD